MKIFYKNILLFKINIFFVILFVCLQNFANAWTYPISQISKTSCRFENWELHSPDCKLDLPKIKDWKYEDYIWNIKYLSIYSVLRWATYTNRRDQWYWSHPWVDIVTAVWTPVRSIWDWEVIFADYYWSWWYVIVVKHKEVASVYAHLDSIFVKKWDKVFEWDRLWRVWDTWNSTASHLHFQIDRLNSPKHPFWYFGSCSIWNLDIIVNNWLCRDQLLKYTVDPILFLETNWAWLYSYQFENQTRYDNLDIAKIISNQKIKKYEYDQIAKRLNFDFNFNLPYISSSWETKLNIITNIDKNIVLNRHIKIKSSNPNITIFPDTISEIWKQRSIMLLPKNDKIFWKKITIGVFFGKRLIRKKQIIVEKNNF